MSCIKDRLVLFFPQEADATDNYTACTLKKFEKSFGKPNTGRERGLRIRAM